MENLPEELRLAIRRKKITCQKIGSFYTIDYGYLDDPSRNLFVASNFYKASWFDWDILLPPEDHRFDEAFAIDPQRTKPGWFFISGLNFNGFLRRYYPEYAANKQNGDFHYCKLVDVLRGQSENAHYKEFWRPRFLEDISATKPYALIPQETKAPPSPEPAESQEMQEPARIETPRDFRLLLIENNRKVPFQYKKQKMLAFINHIYLNRHAHLLIHSVKDGELIHPNGETIITVAFPPPIDDDTLFSYRCSTKSMTLAIYKDENGIYPILAPNAVYIAHLLGVPEGIISHRLSRLRKYGHAKKTPQGKEYGLYWLRLPTTKKLTAPPYAPLTDGSLPLPTPAAAPSYRCKLKEYAVMGPDGERIVFKDADEVRFFCFKNELNTERFRNIVYGKCLEYNGFKRTKEAEDRALSRYRNAPRRVAPSSIEETKVEVEQKAPEETSFPLPQVPPRPALDEGSVTLMRRMVEQEVLKFYQSNPPPIQTIQNADGEGITEIPVDPDIEALTHPRVKNLMYLLKTGDTGTRDVNNRLRANQHELTATDYHYIMCKVPEGQLYQWAEKGLRALGKRGQEGSKEEVRSTKPEGGSKITWSKRVILYRNDVFHDTFNRIKKEAKEAVAPVNPDKGIIQVGNQQITIVLPENMNSIGKPHEDGVPIIQMEDTGHIFAIPSLPHFFRLFNYSKTQKNKLRCFIYSRRLHSINGYSRIWLGDPLPVRKDAPRKSKFKPVVTAPPKKEVGALRRAAQRIKTALTYPIGRKPYREEQKKPTEQAH